MQLQDFVPYMLNQAAESVSREFQKCYRDRYGMLRTEWRVLFHLGIHGEMTATAICARASIHKTKVSRAVQALETKRFVEREEDANDRRAERLRLTRAGRAAFEDLRREAEKFEAHLESTLDAGDITALRRILAQLAGIG